LKNQLIPNQINKAINPIPLISPIPPVKANKYTNAKSKYMDWFKETAPKKQTEIIALSDPKIENQVTPTLNEKFKKKRALRLQEKQEAKKEESKKRHTIDQINQDHGLMIIKAQSYANKGKEYIITMLHIDLRPVLEDYEEDSIYLNVNISFI
jgi:hypothetical protein